MAENLRLFDDTKHAASIIRKLGGAAYPGHRYRSDGLASAEAATRIVKDRNADRFAMWHGEVAECRLYAAKWT
jgi:hypothetical protein